jgi:hypothetical protein
MIHTYFCPYQLPAGDSVDAVYCRLTPGSVKSDDLIPRAEGSWDAKE